MVYLSLGFSKIATILLVRRLFIRDMKAAWSICNVVVAIMAIWTVASAIMVSAGCSAESLSPHTGSKLCAGLKTRFLFLTVADGVTDLVLAILPAYLCRHLHMKFMFKLQVLGVFALRLPLLVLAGLSYKYWIISIAGDHDTDIIRTTALSHPERCAVGGYTRHLTERRCKLFHMNTPASKTKVHRRLPDCSIH